MSWISTLPIIGRIVGEPLAQILNNLGAEDRRAFEKAMAEIDNQYAVQIEQIRANAAAAQHPSMFVAGARPAILWLCALGIAGIALGYLAAIFNIPFTNINMTALEQGEGFILMLAIPLLGIGSMRTVEKLKGVARNSL